MKILMVTPYFWPRPGGLEAYAYQIGRQLTTLGHEVHVVTSGETTETEAFDGLTVHRLAALVTVSNTPFHPFWFVQVRRLVRKLRPDVINVHAPVPSMALVALAVSGTTPIVTTYHAGSMKKGRLAPDVLIWVYERLLLPTLLRRSKVVIAASPFVAEQFLSRWSAKTVVITPGIDTARFTPGPKLAANRVLFIGDSRDPRKGLHYLLEAVSRLPKVTLRVVGQSLSVKRPRVSYTGVLRGQELVDELRAASVLVLPSITEAESFGMVLLEGMATGLPVIATRIGGMPDVVTDGVTGRLVRPGDTEALVAAIDELTTDQALAAQMGRHGRQEAVKRYGWPARGMATQSALTRALEAPTAVVAEVNRG